MALLRRTNNNPIAISERELGELTSRRAVRSNRSLQRPVLQSKRRRMRDAKACLRQI